jgi:hypothetical protein
MTALLKALDEGEASGIAEGDVFEELLQARQARRRATPEAKIA